MTSMTEDEFGTYCLRLGGWLGAEETATSADLEWAKLNNASIIMMLGNLGLPIWNGSELSVPDEYQNVLAVRCLLGYRFSFGASSVEESVAAQREAERNLALMASPKLRNPSEMRTNDIGVGLRSVFDFTTGR